MKQVVGEIIVNEFTRILFSVGCAMHSFLCRRCEHMAQVYGGRARGPRKEKQMRTRDGARHKMRWENIGTVQNKEMRSTEAGSLKNEAAVESKPKQKKGATPAGKEKNECRHKHMMNKKSWCVEVSRMRIWNEVVQKMPKSNRPEKIP